MIKQGLLVIAGDFRREDIAAALVCMSINDTVQNIFRSCVLGKVKRVFVAGSYTNRDFVRSRFTYEWLQQQHLVKAMGEYTVSYPFSVRLYFDILTDHFTVN